MEGKAYHTRAESFKYPRNMLSRTLVIMTCVALVSCRGFVSTIQPENVQDGNVRGRNRLLIAPRRGTLGSESALVFDSAVAPAICLVASPRVRSQVVYFQAGWKWRKGKGWAGTRAERKKDWGKDVRQQRSYVCITPASNRGCSYGAPDGNGHGSTARPHGTHLGGLQKR